MMNQPAAAEKTTRNHTVHPVRPVVCPENGEGTRPMNQENTQVVPGTIPGTEPRTGKRGEIIEGRPGGLAL